MPRTSLPCLCHAATANWTPDFTGALLSQLLDANLDYLQPQLAGLDTLSLDVQAYEPIDYKVCSADEITLNWSAMLTSFAPLSMTAPHYNEATPLQGFFHLTNLTRLTVSCLCSMDDPLLTAVAELTSLRALRLPQLDDWPMPSPLSTLR